MLQITSGAAALLTQIRESSDLPDEYGLRVFPEASEAGEMTIGLGFTDAPATGDVVSEQEGLKLFVAPELNEALGETTIDVADTDGASSLVIRPSEPQDGSSLS